MSFLSDFLSPKQDSFMAHLRKQAEIDVRGLESLVAYMQDPTDENVKLLFDAEHEADEQRRILVDELNRTFVTPIDREDIHGLSRAVDDLIDYAYTTVEEMRVLEVEPDEHLRRMAGHLLEGAKEIHLALERLEQHPRLADEHARKAKREENKMEKTYRKAIAALFAGEKTPENIVCMMKKREVYRHLSNAADRCDEAANVISDIVVKMT